jgi:hypothetical protein
MPGPAPKSDLSRRRRNLPPSSTALVLPPRDPNSEADDPTILSFTLPELRPDGQPWAPQVHELVKAIWDSPQARQLHHLDIHTMMPLLDLYHMYWSIDIYQRWTVMDEEAGFGTAGHVITDPATGMPLLDSTKVGLRVRVHSEIRLSEDKYGFTPLALSVLKWQIAEQEQAEASNERQRPSRPRFGSLTSGSSNSLTP